MLFRSSSIVDGKKYYFCCEGCQAIFLENPTQFIEELNKLHVCPVCLAEKVLAQTVEITCNDLKLHFCRCPFCAETFKQDPEFYLARLKGETDFKGLFDGQKTSCCSEAVK